MLQQHLLFFCFFFRIHNNVVKPFPFFSGKRFEYIIWVCKTLNLEKIVKRSLYPIYMICRRNKVAVNCTLRIISSGKFFYRV
jgi:hypothetical protein